MVTTNTTVHDHPYEPRDPNRPWGRCKYCPLAEASHISSVPPIEPPSTPRPVGDDDQMTRLEKVLKMINPVLPEGQWFINGSGALYLNGIDNGRPMGDLNIFMATRPWFEILKPYTGAWNTGWKLVTPDPDDPECRADPPYLLRDILGLPVRLFFSWRTRHVADIDVNYLIHNAEIVCGYPCAPLRMILDWKEQKLRAKDATDIEAIRRQRPDLFEEAS